MTEEGHFARPRLSIPAKCSMTPGCFRLACIQGVILGAMFSSAAVAADDVVFQNDLASCVTPEITRLRTEANIISADVDFQGHKPIGACGCISALATYTSSVKVEGARQTVMEGIVAIKAAGPKTLILATEPALVAGRQVQVRLTCARPL